MNKKILIVDDEERARTRLSRLILEIDPQALIVVAKNGLEAIEQMKSLKLDIVFLDIQMPGMNGLEALGQVQERNFQVVFQTAYDEYALQAFEENACDYLLKPIKKERLMKSMEKAFKSRELEDQLEKLEKSFTSKGHYLENLSVKTGEKVFMFKTQEIDCFSGQEHYTLVCCEDKEYLIDLTLSHLESRLNPELFFRCHRSHILNLQKVDSLTLGSSMKVLLKSGRELPVSRQKRKEMKEKVKI